MLLSDDGPLRYRPRDRERQPESEPRQGCQEARCTRPSQIVRSPGKTVQGPKRRAERDRRRNDGQRDRSAEVQDALER